jgi:ACR3 family arsenite transporter
MSGQREAKRLDFFERYLTAWVFLCMVLGLALGRLAPELVRSLGAWEFGRGSHVNVPVAVLIWLMIFPMMLKIDFGAIKGVFAKPKGLFVTLFVNWLVKPFSMALLGWLFITLLFSHVLGWIPPETAKNYVAGLIILAAAPCTAMVFVWSYLTDGDGPYTLAQVAVNDLIMVFAFAPIVALLLGLSSIVVPWETLTTSVVLYIVIPVLLAQAWRYWLLKQGGDVLNAVMEKIGSWSITALLLTLVLLFGFQGKAIIDQPLIIGLLAVPILIQVFFNASLAYWLNKKLGESHSVACPSALIGASNFFELAVAAAINLFGFQSGAALATVVGVLIEVPVMLIGVRVVNQSKNWCEST